MIPLMRNTFYNELETKKALSEFILGASRLSMAEKCFEFEKAFSKYQGRAYSILFNSGASANLALLQSLKNMGYLEIGEKIGISAVTWSTNVMPIIQMGLKPIAIDCDPKTLNISSLYLKEHPEFKKIKVLFITNALGFTGDLPVIRNLCEENGIILLEDNCESLGTELPSGMAGNFGLASSFSFFVAHHLSTVEGGMVCTDNEELSEMLIIVRANGWDRNLDSQKQLKWRKQFNINSELEAKYTFYDLGFNFRPTEITGFLGLYQLNFLNENIYRRERNYLYVEKTINDNPDIITIDHSHIKRLSSFAMPFVCKTPAIRNKYVSIFAREGIEIRPLIAGNIQRQPFYNKYVQNKNMLKGADHIHNCAFYCGNYPEMTDADLELIVRCLKT